MSEHNIGDRVQCRQRDGWNVLAARTGVIVGDEGDTVQVRPHEPWFGERRNHTQRVERGELKTPARSSS